MKVLPIPSSVELPSKGVDKVVAPVLVYLDNLVRPLPVWLEFSDFLQNVSSVEDQVTDLKISLLDMFVVRSGHDRLIVHGPG